MRLFLALSLLAVEPLAAQTGWVLTWSDEFDGANLDANKWVYAIGGNGWGNNELEYYTNRLQNVYLENGTSVIKAVKETYTGPDGVTRNYTSGRIRTQGKFSQAYGRFEARIKVPYGQGIWPALWMLGDDYETAGWPACGEIDIMENIGREPSTVHGTIHGPGYSGGNGIGAAYSLPAGRRFADDFHLFAIEWEPGVIRWYVDDQLYKTITPANLPRGTRWVFDHPFYLLLNLAVGGNWPGIPDQSTVFPQYMLVDYVRVYKREGKPVIASENGVLNGASFQPAIAPGSWVTIKGMGLASNTRSWRSDDFVDGKLPTQLDGTSVSINGKPAAIAYICPYQINAQAPDTGPGSVAVEVTSNGLKSDPVVAQAQTFSPAFFVWEGKYAVATRLDFSPVAKAGLFSGLTTLPAKPGEILILWGTGFGPTEPAIPAGQKVDRLAWLVTDPTVRVGGLLAQYFGGALAPGYAGLYQIAVRLPDALPEGDLPLAAETAGYRSPDNVFITVAK